MVITCTVREITLCRFSGCRCLILRLVMAGLLRSSTARQPIYASSLLLICLSEISTGCERWTNSTS